MGKRRLAYAAWLLFAGLVYFFENNTGTRALLAGSVLIPAGSVACAIGSVRRAAWELQAPVSVGRSDAAPCTVCVRGLLPGAVCTGTLRAANRLCCEETRLPVTLAGPSGTARTRLSSGHCGMLELSLEDVRIRDWFGLWQSAPLPEKREHVLVQPELFVPEVCFAQGETPSADGERWSMTRPGNDPSETFSIREYIPGDPVHQIHWKLSQKTDTLMLRELGLPVAEETLLLLDTTVPETGPDPAAMDAAVCVLLSLSRALALQGIAHRVGWKDRGLNELILCAVHTPEEWGRMEEQILAAAAASDGEGVCSCFRKWSGGGVYAHTVVCAPALPEGLEKLCAGNRVTLMLPASVACAADAVQVIPFPEEGPAQALASIEI